jgi:hypothetical protein
MCGRVRLSSDYSEIKIALKFDLAFSFHNRICSRRCTTRESSGLAASDR